MAAFVTNLFPIMEVVQNSSKSVIRLSAKVIDMFTATFYRLQRIIIIVIIISLQALCWTAGGPKRKK